jgi:hypothetical protein
MKPVNAVTVAEWPTHANSKLKKLHPHCEIVFYARRDAVMC